MDLELDYNKVFMEGAPHVSVFKKDQGFNYVQQPVVACSNL